MAARSFGISKTTISRHLLKFQEQETLRILNTQPEMMLRKFSVPHRNLNWLSISNRLQNYVMVAQRSNM
jgi:hypothetical protein